VSRLELAYVGGGRFAPTGVRFRKAVEQGAIQIEDYSNFQMTLRFLAGAMGLPFLPTRSGFGTDIMEKWGFTEEMRRADPRLPDRKMVVLNNPFGDWGDASRVVLVPAINPDVTIIHVQEADPQGTARIKGLTFADVEQAKAARHLVLTCEDLVGPEDLREDPDQNQIPFFCADAVVHAPFGAYPTSCYRYYDYDPAFLNQYRDWASDDGRYRDYLERFVLGVRDHEEFLDRVGRQRLERIKADPRTGYAVGLNRG
jgi:glutaconate CoA-transferase subunit A